MSIARRYWDSSVFLAWLLPEPARESDCRAVIRAAEAGDLQIVTSAITLTEVIKLKGEPPLKREHERKILRFLQHDYIIVLNLDRFIAEIARALTWDHSLESRDAIHLATAMRHEIGVLDTYDHKDLIPLNGKFGNPLIRIGPPHIVHEQELPFPKPKAEDEPNE
jgi:predicted nucleic acid-binding protein